MFVVGNLYQEIEGDAPLFCCLQFCYCFLLCYCYHQAVSIRSYLLCIYTVVEEGRGLRFLRWGGRGDSHTLT